LEAQKQDLDAKLGQLAAQLKQAEDFDAQRKVIEAETQAFAGVFNQVKPWSAMLQDVSERIPPGVQLDSLQESAGQILISGTARSYSDVNDFLLLLQKSPFLKAQDTQIQSAQVGGFVTPVKFTGLGPQGKPRYELPKVVSYRLVTRLNDIPASELLRELDRKGAVGLVTRIRTLQEKGVIKP
jgi:type IV pilus assembly protein PilN